ncbi:MAG: hypothetical protein ABI720_09955, partial [Actinomycetes bacterium]
MSQPPLAPQRPYTHTEHDVERPDPYSWLKDKTSEESMAYLRAERAFYDEQMSPFRPLIDELTSEMIARVPKSEDSARWREGEYEYFTREPAGQEYPQLLRADATGLESIVLDQNSLVDPGEYVEV